MYILKHFTFFAIRVVGFPINRNIFNRNLQIPEHNPISGLDAIFILDNIALEDALDRAMGKIHDPLTGDEYHLEMNPPRFQEHR